MIVTIDGPAGAGKSSLARALATRLGFRFLDTGAMYRAVVWAALNRGVDLADESAVAKLTGKLNIHIDDRKAFVDGTDVSDEIRSMDITRKVFHVADNHQVREILSELQRNMTATTDVVTEGRDQGTVVFPNADCKIFLTASPEERAQRRLQDIRRRGEDMSFDEVLRLQNERDYRDLNRNVGQLKKAEDAIEFVTDGMSPESVLQKLEEIVRSKLPIHE